MNWVELLQLLITSGERLAESIDPKLGETEQEVVSYINAGLDAFRKAHNTAVTLPQLESLRTVKLW